MRNVLGVILTALGGGLIAWPFSTAAAAVVVGALLIAGTVLFVIDLGDRPAPGGRR